MESVNRGWMVALAVACVLVPGSALASSWDDGLIAYYSFDNPNDLTRDDSGNGYHGKAVGFVQPMTKGIKGGAVFIEGPGSHIVVDAMSNCVWGTVLTVSLWFYRSDEFNWYPMLAGVGPTRQPSWWIRAGPEQNGQALGCTISSMLDKSGWDVMNIGATVKSWHHVVVTYDGVEVLMYLDDVIHEGDGDDQGAILNLGKPLYLGGSAEPFHPGPDKSEHLTGMLDEVLIYNRVLSRAEISALFRNEHVVEGRGGGGPGIHTAVPTDEAAGMLAPAPAVPPAEVESAVRAPDVVPAAELPTARPVPPQTAPSQEERDCCETLKRLAREWEKGNVQNVMSILEQVGKE